MTTDSTRNYACDRMLSLRVPAWVYAALEGVARAECGNVSWAARRALVEWLEGQAERGGDSKEVAE